MPNEAEAIPDELKAPIGVADDLLLPPTTPVENDTVSGGVLGKGDNGEEVNGTEASKKEESGEKNGVESQGNGEDSPGTVRFFRCFLLLLFFDFLSLCGTSRRRKWLLEVGLMVALWVLVGQEGFLGFSRCTTIL
jgi:hypothetical protein